ncbi:xanthine dehydrogenase family protein molybdopterin-binding subunit [Bradyrhizobium sp. AZCC 2289]|uniref:xanthine dehydrogenase family protein molybdopterin-binding subunit n=1 Tax=Bradyrhizobium sp. AZCC 2289 TaxID=3117026 RepID=UPI002FF40561
MMTTTRMTRRQFFEKLGKGSLVVGFSLSPVAASILAEEAHAASVDSQLTILSGIASGSPPQNDAWLTIDHQGKITLFSGKVEIGTGTQTAFSQIVAEELYVDVSTITYVQGDTSQTTDQGFTAGSKSIQVQGPLVRRAAATAFQALLGLGGSIGIGPEKYAKLFNGQQITLNSNASAALKDPSNYTVVGKSVRRLDLLDKFTGRFAFVSDIVVPGMLHGRVVRVNGGTVSKAKNATFQSLDDTAARTIPGYVQTVQKGNFVGVVATTEWAAIQAAKALQVTWTNGAPLVSDSVEANLQAALTNGANVYSPNKTQEVVGNADSVYNTAPANLKFTRDYYSPYQMHGSVAPSCALANVTSAPDANGIQATVWSGTQGVYPLQQAIADILGLSPSKVRVIYVEGPGCYGHNGADDAAADAALMSQLLGRPVRVQWMRWDEHGWEPLGPAMAHTLKGALDAGRNVVSWSHTVNTPPHNSRPGGGGALLAGQETGLIPSNLPAVSINSGTRNGPVNYNFPNIKLTENNVQPYQTNGGTTLRPLVNTLPRSTALRSLGGMSNCFANESFMDELAMAANLDPVTFRKNYACALSGGSGSATSVPVPGTDPRATAALDAMAQQAGWGNSLASPTKGDVAGKGVAFARYETVETYVAVYAEVEVTNATGEVWVRRVVVAHDCGLIINPDGLKNQIEGNVIQAISRTLIEEVGFNTTGVTSLLWASANPTAPPGTIYPVVHFNQVPSSIEIVLLNHPDQLTQDPANVPSWGAGEPTIGPVAPAIANAIFSAIGKRLTVLPITKPRVLYALTH